MILFAGGVAILRLHWHWTVPVKLTGVLLSLASLARIAVADAVKPENPATILGTTAGLGLSSAQICGSASYASMIAATSGWRTTSLAVK